MAVVALVDLEVAEAVEEEVVLVVAPRVAVVRVGLGRYEAAQAC